MPGRTPTEAITDFIAPIQKALNYIAIGRLAFGRTSDKQLGDSVQSISFNDGNPVRLSTPRSSPVFLSTSLWIRLREHANRREPYSCEVVTYWHTLESNNGAEIIAFHWTPGAGSRARPFPHIHIGSLVAGGGKFMPERFHKLHIPTGSISVEEIVRFAIEELAVEVRPGFDRATVLNELSRSIESE